MDLSTFSGLSQRFDEGVEVEIRHPVTEKKLGLTVRVASYQSERVKKIMRRQANAAMKERQRNPKKAMTVEQAEERSHEIIIAAVVDWSGFEMKGEPLECTPENVRAVIENPDLWWIGEQIDKAAEDQAAFIPA